MTTSPDPESAKALFLDRDGVINVERNYVHTCAEFDFVEGIFELCRAAQARGYRIFVVTNQAGIARGYYSEEVFQQLTQWMLGEFVAHGIQIERVYYCPFHPEHGVGRYRCDSPDRKPAPGMLLRAQSEYGLDLAQSVLIGDRPSDIEAARAAGVGRAILLSSDPIADAAPDARAETLSEIQALLFGEIKQSL